MTGPAGNRVRTLMLHVIGMWAPARTVSCGGDCGQRAMLKFAPGIEAGPG